MSMFVTLVCVAMLGRVRAEEVIVNRHFKGDMFSKRGKSNQVKLEKRASYLAGFYLGLI